MTPSSLTDNKWKPAVQRRWLFLIVGIVWMLVGGSLCLRAYHWLLADSVNVAVPVGAGGVILAGAGYLFGFARLARKNINRISALPHRPCVFAFTGWRGYFIISLMITTGILLRQSPIPRNYLALLYTAMGGALLLGCVSFFRSFLKSNVPGGDIGPGRASESES